MFNLVRGLQHEIDEDPAAAPVLQPLKDRAERILKDLEERKTTGLAAMDQLAALAAEKEAAMKVARDSGLSARAFAVAWVLREDAAVKAAGIDPMTLAKDAEELLGRFPNASVNADEQRRLRASLYKPLLALAQDERATCQTGPGYRTSKRAPFCPTTNSSKRAWSVSCSASLRKWMTVPDL